MDSWVHEREKENVSKKTYGNGLNVEQNLKLQLRVAAYYTGFTKSLQHKWILLKKLQDMLMSINILQQL